MHAAGTSSSVFLLTPQKEYRVKKEELLFSIYI